MSVLERVRKVERMRGASLRGARERLKADLVDRLGLDAMAGMLTGEGGARARAELSVALESALNTGEYEDVALCDRASLVDQVLDEVCGLGPIQPLLEDASITEVMINGCDALFYERGGEICQAETRFDSPEQIMIAIDRILAPLGRRLDRASPLVSARLPNGDRVNAVADPISIDGPSITIRKFSDRAWTLRRLVGLGALPAWYATLLSWAVRTKCGIAVAGGTGSGKTTLLLPDGTPPVRGMLAAFATPIMTAQDSTGSRLNTEGMLEITLLYMTDENTAPVTVHQETPFRTSFAVSAAPDSIITLTADEVEATPITSDRVELRYVLRLTCDGVETQSAHLLTDAQEETADEVDDGLYLCYCQTGEDWWTLAKEYRVPQEKLRRLNPDLPDALKAGTGVVVWKKSP